MKSLPIPFYLNILPPNFLFCSITLSSGDPLKFVKARAVTTAKLRLYVQDC